MKSVSAMTGAAAQPFSSRNAANTPVKATMDATEMSIPPVSRTNVMPTETTIR